MGKFDYHQLSICLLVDLHLLICYQFITHEYLESKTCSKCEVFLMSLKLIFNNLNESYRIYIFFLFNVKYNTAENCIILWYNIKYKIKMWIFLHIS